MKATACTVTLFLLLAVCAAAAPRQSRLPRSTDDRSPRDTHASRTTAAGIASPEDAWHIDAARALRDQDAATMRQDAAILHDIVRQVNGYTRLTVFDDVGVTVDAGTVTLTGKVTAPYKKDQIVSRVRKVPGIVELRDQIGVLPVSQDDDELRYRIAGAIYGNPSFWEYAALANPPIHIIVEHGHVTLVGVVRTDVERVLARSLASVFGVRSITNNLKTEAEIRRAEPQA